MYLQHLSVQGFKNYISEQISFTDKITSFVGDNGAGKTNILDAIHYLSFCKSYFSSSDVQNIIHGGDQFSVLGRFTKGQDSSIDSVHCVVRKAQRKLFKVNGKEIGRMADHIGKMPAVMVSPYDHVLIDGGSEERRRYLDMVISQIDKHYLDDLIYYNRALTQRNALLRQFSSEHFYDSALLEPWDEQIIAAGSRIFEGRNLFFKEFTPVFKELYREIVNDTEECNIKYISQLSSDKNFPTLLKEAVEKDRALRYSSVGTHKDDLQLMLSGVPVKKFGSQGQQKSFILALKLAQFRFLHRELQIKPILLLDDVFDKLDKSRIERLMEMVNSSDFGQIFITDTNVSRIEHIFSGISSTSGIINISNGAVEK